MDAFYNLLEDQWTLQPADTILSLMVFLNKYGGDLLLARLRAYLSRDTFELIIEDSNHENLLDSARNLELQLRFFPGDAAASALHSSLGEFIILYQWSDILYEGKVESALDSFEPWTYSGIFKLLTRPYPMDIWTRLRNAMIDTDAEEQDELIETMRLKYPMLHSHMEKFLFSDAPDTWINRDYRVTRRLEYLVNRIQIQWIQFIKSRE
jgi:hypothetical protein